jgi:hypothetical protein
MVVFLKKLGTRNVAVDASLLLLLTTEERGSHQTTKGMPPTTMGKVRVTVWRQGSSEPPSQVSFNPERSSVEQVVLKAAEALGVRHEDKVWNLLVRGKCTVTELDDMRDGDILYLQECVCIKPEANDQQEPEREESEERRQRQQPRPEIPPRVKEEPHAMDISLSTAGSDGAAEENSARASSKNPERVVTPRKRKQRSQPEEQQLKNPDKIKASHTGTTRKPSSDSLSFGPILSSANDVETNMAQTGIILVAEYIELDDDDNWKATHREGADNPTGSLYWEQQDTGKQWDGNEHLLDIERFAQSAMEVKLRRVRNGRAIAKVAGTPIVYDLEQHWFIAEGEEPRQKGAGSFDMLPRTIIQQICMMAIGGPADHYALATSSKEFMIVCEDRLVVAHTATVATQGARHTKLQADETAEKARSKSLESGAKIIKFESGEWRGQRSRAKKPSGLGVYLDFEAESTSAGTFKCGLEEGLCKMIHQDGSTYVGEFKKGEREGYGINWTGQGERYEGSWVQDKRHGYGLLLGGAWPFTFGRYVAGEPVGMHICWNNNSDTVTLCYD